jgi:hypothetical protein
VEAGADGLVLLTAGAGGQTGWLNPFVFVRAVRAFFDGPIVLAGGIGDGHALHAARALGCDLAYMGTKFIATNESMADARHKQMLVSCSADDVLLTSAITGLQTNILRPSIVAAGLDPDDLPPRGMIDIAKDIDVGERDKHPARWRDIWSAGHSTSGVTEVLPVETLVRRTTAEYLAGVTPQVNPPLTKSPRQSPATAAATSAGQVGSCCPLGRRDMDIETQFAKTPASLDEIRQRVGHALHRHPLCRNVQFDILSMPRSSKGNWTISLRSVAPGALWEASDIVSDIQNAYDLSAAI